MTIEVVTRWWVHEGAETTPVAESTSYDADLATGAEEVVAVSNMMPVDAHEITAAAAERLLERSRQTALDSIAAGNWPIPGVIVGG